MHLSQVTVNPLSNPANFAASPRSHGSLTRFEYDAQAEPGWERSGSAASTDCTMAALARVTRV